MTPGKTTLFLLLLSFNVFPYGWVAHKNIALAAIHSLRVSGYNDFAKDLIIKRPELDNLSYIEIIVDGYNGFEGEGGVLGPDKLGIEDPATIQKFNSIIETYYNGFVPALIRPFYTLDQLKAKLALMANSQGITDLNGDAIKGTQHTYAVDIHADPTDPLIPLSCANKLAQQEYELAVFYKNNGELKKALAQLGRAIHYLQDVTVPHHAKFRQNYWDVLAGVLNNTPSQQAYEEIHSGFCFSVTQDPDNLDASKWIVVNASATPSQYVLTDQDFILGEADDIGIVTKNGIERPGIKEKIEEIVAISKQYFDYCDGML